MQSAPAPPVSAESLRPHRIEGRIAGDAACDGATERGEVAAVLGDVDADDLQAGRAQDLDEDLADEPEPDHAGGLAEPGARGERACWSTAAAMSGLWPRSTPSPAIAAPAPLPLLATPSPDLLPCRQQRYVRSQAAAAPGKINAARVGPLFGRIAALGYRLLDLRQCIEEPAHALRRDQPVRGLADRPRADARPSRLLRPHLLCSGVCGSRSDDGLRPAQHLPVRGAWNPARHAFPAPAAQRGEGGALPEGSHLGRHHRSSSRTQRPTAAGKVSSSRRTISASSTSRRASPMVSRPSATTRG